MHKVSGKLCSLTFVWIWRMNISKLKFIESTSIRSFPWTKFGVENIRFCGGVASMLFLISEGDRPDNWRGKKAQRREFNCPLRDRCAWNLNFYFQFERARNCASTFHSVIPLSTSPSVQDATPLTIHSSMLIRISFWWRANQIALRAETITSDTALSRTRIHMLRVPHTDGPRLHASLRQIKLIGRAISGWALNRKYRVADDTCRINGAFFLNVFFLRKQKSQIKSRKKLRNK